ncbi:MAG: Holliday junction resolvase Hjc [Candidatus Woesearchaeota archaeon]
MSQKSRGISAERELVHLFQKKGYAAIRIAGSGNTKTPSTDILAGNGLRILSIECKIVKGTSRYLDCQTIDLFVDFSRQFGAEPWIAVKFFRKPWMMILVSQLLKTEKNYIIQEKYIMEHGCSLEHF